MILNGIVQDVINKKESEFDGKTIPAYTQVLVYDRGVGLVSIKYPYGNANYEVGDSFQENIKPTYINGKQISAKIVE